MHRVWPAALFGLGMIIVGAGCMQPGAAWGAKPAKPTIKPTTRKAVVPADGSETALAGASGAAAGDRAEASAGKAKVDEAHQRVVEFFDGLTQTNATPDIPADRPSGAPFARGPYEPVLPTHAVVEGPPAPAPAAAVNVGMDLATATPEPSTDDVDAVPTPAEKPQVQIVSIRSSLPDDDQESKAAPTLGVNTALESTDDAPARTLDESIAALKEYVTQHPNDVEAVWRLVFLLMGTGQEFEIEQFVSELNQDAGQTIAHTAKLVRGVRAALREPGPASDRALDAIDALRARFTRDAELLIPRVALCTRVSTFGVYDEMEMSRLVPLRANRAIVYCEIKNFHSESLPDQKYRVTLSSRLELLTPDGRSLWTHDEPVIEDLSKQRREDFFLAQLVTFPAGIGPGEYILKVTIEDRAAAKASEVAYPFQLGTPAITQAERRQADGLIPRPAISLRNGPG